MSGTPMPTHGSTPPRCRIKATPEDFVVEEVPAYEPSGAGDHVFVRFTKRERTTMDTVRDIARALGCDPRAAGFGGMKDKRAVTTQSMSLQPPRGVTSLDLAARARALTLEGVTVHEATPHPHKMKPGHLSANRFTIVLRDLPEDRLDEVTAAFERIAREGVGNAFGTQRFGSRGDNAARALAWLRGEERGPRDPRVGRLLWSSLQSAVFNAVLDARLADGTWNVPLQGDLLKLRSSGGMFGCADVQTDTLRAAAGEVSPTGPIIGARMRWPEGAPADLERRVSNQVLGEDFDLSRTRSLGEGSRRALRLWVEDLRWERVKADRGDGAETSGKSGACVRVYFVLPKGAYATTVLSAAAAIEEVRSAEGAPTADDEETDGAIAT
ncbi:MAG TPA: tRNA pseudouridine(13) synthase TruD [Polyangiaceae bacterium]|jgi:tRNA pseudouridine13 synthase|nr:tRNA pseudouridine(13) synthase TruD [Polyangiaceae bacterium]